MQYEELLARKRLELEPCGFETQDLNPMLFEFQRDTVRWALRIGRACIFADCGLGKTPMQLEWARHVSAHTGKPVLILAPLAVSHQTQREGQKFGIGVTIARDQSQVRPGVNVTNYEKLPHFQASAFGGVVLDESSILKSYTGSTRNEIIQAFASTPYKLACTATPAPNDYMELGNHSEFIGALTRVEMLGRFFIHDGGDTAKWRLRGHASKPFWEWLCGWAVYIRKPSDIGYDDAGFALPALDIQQHTVESPAESGRLFAVEASTLDERRRAKRETVGGRVAKVAQLVNGSEEPWVIWCNLNAESAALASAIPGAVEVRGDMEDEEKEAAVLGFSAGTVRVLVTKPSISGFGMNWQHCARMAFVGLSDSYEQYYQAMRRCWRFGQTRQVEVHIVTAEAEGPIARNIASKEKAALEMAENMVAHMSDLNRASVHGVQKMKTDYETADAAGEDWELKLGDCVERCAEIPTESVGFSVFSPPFASLYTYSDSDRDMGNCAGWEEFMEHFRFLVRELYRVTMPGRNLSFHCMNLPISKEREGHIGLRDFRGILIRCFEEEGWIYHSEVTIWKDPVTAMQRTKAIGLLWKQLKKDSTISRQGIPDYLVTMRKPGANPSPVSHTAEEFPVAQWQQWASPVWMDINPSRTLNRDGARDADDDRHICPLQLDVIERAIELWSKPGDIVLSPFAGIGSEGYVALQRGRRFVGIELKRSYFEQAILNLNRALLQNQPSLFADGAE